MFSKVFLAQTARELQENPQKQTAYMACHFSPYGTGLSNLPDKLPENSMLLLDDSTPVSGHDPATVTKQLEKLAAQFSLKAVLLDFQREKTPETTQMAKAIQQVLPCPVAVTKPYARELGGPVFLPPTPVNRSLQAHIQPWRNQGVFLEISAESLQISVTEQGSVIKALQTIPPIPMPLVDSRLRCHYQVKVFPEKAVFTLRRTKEDLAALTEEAYRSGVLGVVGLYQELQAL